MMSNLLVGLLAIAGSLSLCSEEYIGGTMFSLMFFFVLYAKYKKT